MLDNNKYNLVHLILRIQHNIYYFSFTMQKLQNPTPKLYEAFKLTYEELEDRKNNQLNPQVQDPIDSIEVFELIRYLNDPQYPLTLEQLNVVNVERCYVVGNKMQVHFTPTIPHCSMAQMIGLMIKVKLCQFLPTIFKARVYVTAGTHVNQNEINKQINDKERIAAAIQNPNILRILRRGFHNSDRFAYENY